MEFTAYTKDIRADLKHVAKCADPKPQTPILASVHLLADEERGHLYLSATDFSIAALACSPVNVREGGAACVDARYLLEVIGNIKEETVTFATRDNMLNVTAGGVNFDLPTFNESEFPSPKFPTAPAVEVNASVFKEMLRKTMFAVSKGIDRPIFTGVNIQTQNNAAFTTVRAQATNAARIAHFTGHAKPTDAPDLNIIVPSNQLQIINAAIPDDYETVIQLRLEGNSLGIKFNNLCFKTRLIEGEFPATDKILADETRDKVVTFYAAEMKPLLDSANLVAKTGEFKAVTLNLSENQIGVSATSPERGNFQATCEANCNSELTIGFNVEYLLDFFKSAGCKTVRAKFKDKYDPVELTDDANPEDFTCVITPVRM